MALRATIVGVAGATNAGKSTLSKDLVACLQSKGCAVSLIAQDDFFLKEEFVDIVHNINDPKIKFYNYDKPNSVDERAICQTIREKATFSDFVVVEGNIITELPSVYHLLESTVFLTMSKELCYTRRLTRTYDPPDQIGYFDQIVWPEYEKHLERAKSLQRISFSNVGEYGSAGLEDILSNAICKNEFRLDLIRIQTEPINILQATEFVIWPWCGATSVFVGTTRNIFEGKEVVRLEYESFDKMAYSELRRLRSIARDRYPAIQSVAIIHRTGEVKTGEASVVIATSSPQRKAAIAATEFLIDGLKKNVPIWKKEVYSDGTCSWKENIDNIIQNDQRKD
ncbi:moaE protein domain-containing protein [Ditylenchus destructor]|uniref:MoaE protein domain-containing protein n=1 Tax=Ditylenchus destructor TaxID=166010 RepID=A0AAD4N224_9BILA|nr:moaE protein domain-containing protein [Ditylenchus destructor]